jgi:hypothetical protein
MLTVERKIRGKVFLFLNKLLWMDVMSMYNKINSIITESRIKARLVMRTLLVLFREEKLF